MDNFALIQITLASGLAGFIDAIVGGGGLILLPMMFIVFPSTDTATLIGTSKCASISGTSLAAWRYSRSVAFALPALATAMTTSFMGAFCGSAALMQVSPMLLRQALPFVLLALLIYTLKNPALGQVHGNPDLTRIRPLILLGIAGFLIGFYDGFYGPGTGIILIFVLVRLGGFGFIEASAYAKLMNVATNLASLIVLGSNGRIAWQLLPYLITANILGSWLGSHLAIKGGNAFMRKVFIAVVFALLLRTFFDAWIKTV